MTVQLPTHSYKLKAENTVQEEALILKRTDWNKLHSSISIFPLSIFRARFILKLQDNQPQGTTHKKG